jgi:hypothetical protein
MEKEKDGGVHCIVYPEGRHAHYGVHKKIPMPFHARGTLSFDQKKK